MAVKDGFTLGELITSTAQQIREARDKAPPDTVMQFERCELELAVTLSNEGGGGLKFHFFSAELKAKEQALSRIKLSFGPIPGKPSPAFLSKPVGGKSRPHGAEPR